MEKIEAAEKDYISGMKYAEIAEKYGVSLNTVKSWKKRHGWIRTHKNKEAEPIEGVHPKTKKGAPKRTRVQKVIDPDPEETEDEDEELKKQHKEFCVYFVQSYNATKAYQKAYGCDYYSAAVGANRMLKNVKIRDCIKKLQEMKLARAMITETDILQKYVDIAYADAKDFYDFKRGKAKLKNGEEFDGSVVSDVKIGKEGVTVKLPSVSDRMKALEKIERIFDGGEDEEGGGGQIGVYEPGEGEE